MMTTRLIVGMYLKLLRDRTIYDVATLNPLTIPAGSIGEITNISAMVLKDGTVSAVMACKFTEGGLTIFLPPHDMPFSELFEVL